MLTRIFRNAALVVLLSLGTLVAAQAPHVEVPTQLTAIRQEQSQLRSEIREQRELLTQLMRNVAALNAQSIAQRGVPEEEARQNVQTILPIPDFDAVGAKFQGLEADINRCIAAARGAAQDMQQAGYQFTELANCSAVDRRALSRRIEQLQRDAQARFEECRDAISRDSEWLANSLPYDGAQLTPEQMQALRRAQLVSQEARDCAKELEQTVQDLRDAEKAKAAMSKMLALAANVCFASGGNPYVCGGMLALAILMEIFNGSGDGDGDGDGNEAAGEGDGQGEQAGVPSMTTTPGPRGDGSSPNPGAGGTEPDATLGTLNDGRILCTTNRDAAVCWIKGQQDSARSFSPATRPQSASRSGKCESRLREVVASNTGTPDLVACVRGDNPNTPATEPDQIVGLSLKAGAQYCRIGVQVEGASTFTKFSDPEAVAADAKDACGSAR